MVTRLGEESVNCPLIDGLDGHLQRRLSREHHADSLGELLANFGQEGGPPHNGHVMVSDHHIDGPGTEIDQRLVCRGGAQDLVGFLVEPPAETSKHVRLIINEQYRVLPRFCLCETCVIWCELVTKRRGILDTMLHHRPISCSRSGWHCLCQCASRSSSPSSSRYLRSTDPVCFGASFSSPKALATWTAISGLKARVGHALGQWCYASAS